MNLSLTIKYRGQGIASALIQTIINHAKSRVTQLHLTCVTSNLGVVAFYQKQGFKIYGTEPGALKVRDTFFDEHLMIVDLKGESMKQFDTYLGLCTEVYDFQSIFTIINLILSIFLEKPTKKDIKNSSKPSSQTEKDESSLSDEGAKGKGKQESKTTAYNTRTVETIKVAKVTQCDVCGKDLSKAPCEHHERRTKIDIIFEKVIEHVDAEVKYCTDCHSTVKGTFPAVMTSPLQYGNGLKAL